MPIKTNKTEKDVYGQSDMSSPTASANTPPTVSTNAEPTTETASSRPKAACRQHVDEALGGGHGH